MPLGPSRPFCTCLSAKLSDDVMMGVPKYVLAKSKMQLARRTYMEFKQDLKSWSHHKNDFSLFSSSLQLQNRNRRTWPMKARALVKRHGRPGLLLELNKINLSKNKIVSSFNYQILALSVHLKYGPWERKANHKLLQQKTSNGRTNFSECDSFQFESSYHHFCQCMKSIIIWENIRIWYRRIVSDLQRKTNCAKTYFL